jgi:hypothetical protein
MYNEERPDLLLQLGGVLLSGGGGIENPNQEVACWICPVQCFVSLRQFKQTVGNMMLAMMFGDCTLQCNWI